MTFHWPQIALIVIIMMGFAVQVEKHGEPRMDSYNAWFSLVSLVIVFSILYLGGFFK